jgi:hypothetical protein
MKRRYKMLPLSFPFTHEREFWSDCVGYEIVPRFNRDGWYMDRKWKRVWIEVDGRAWMHESMETFLHELAHTGVRRLEDHVYKALHTCLFDSALIFSGLAYQDLFRTWSVENHLRAMARTRRDARLTMHKFMKSI